MTIGWLDLSAGASGDMLLGALVDAGVPLEVLQTAIAALPVEQIRLMTEQTTRHGLGATRVHVHAPAVAASPHLGRCPRPARRRRPGGGRPRRRPGRVRAARSGRGPGAPGRSATRCTSTRSAPSMRWPTSWAWSPASPTSGWTGSPPPRSRSAAARPAAPTASSPFPGPAVLELLRGVPVVAGAVPAEMCTPDGAALLSRTWSATGRRCRRCGCSGSAWAPAGATRSSCRTSSGWCSAGRPERPASPVVLEANVDDLDPRLWPGVLDTLFAAGRLRRLADPDPDEEGPAGAHAVGAVRPGGGPGGAGGGVRGDVHDRAADRAGRQGGAGARARDGRRPRRPWA